MNSKKKIEIEGWKLVQEKTFKKWINNLYKRNKYHEITDLYQSVSETKDFIKLLNFITGDRIKYNDKPTHRIHYMENMSNALRYLSKKGVKLTNIGPEDIVDKNEKLILGLIWSLIIRFTIEEISEGDLKARDALLYWCRESTKGYNGIDINNFTSSWKDGRAFCAILNKYRPNLLSWDEVDPNNPKSNLTLAFNNAEKVGIQKLLDVSDLLNMAYLDEKSILTYVAQYFHKFSTEHKKTVATKRLITFLQYLKNSKEEVEAYMKEKEFIDQEIEKNVKNILSLLDELKNIKNLEDLIEIIKKIDFHLNESRPDLLLKINNFYEKAIPNKSSKVSNFLKFQDSGIHKEDIWAKWKEMSKKECEMKKLLSAVTYEIKEKIFDKIHDIQIELNHILSEFKEKIRSSNQKNHSEYVKKVTKRVKILEKEAKDQIECIKRCKCTFLISDKEILNFLSFFDSYIEKIAKFFASEKIYEENNIISESERQVIEKIYGHFKDEDGKISLLSFQAACSCFGERINDDILKIVFKENGGGDDFKMEKEYFFKYLSKIIAENPTNESLINSLKTIYGSKNTINRGDLINLGIQSELLDLIFDNTKDGISIEEMKLKFSIN